MWTNIPQQIGKTVLLPSPKSFAIALLLCFLCLINWCSINWAVEKKQTFGSNTEGANSPLVIGRLIRIDKDSVLVEQFGKEKPRQLRFAESTQTQYIGFQGIGKTAKDPEPGFGVRAKVTNDDELTVIVYSPPLPSSNRVIKYRHLLSDQQLFEKVDQNKDKQIDYVEWSISIYRTEKHGPQMWPKMDRDGNDSLNFKEFIQAMSEIEWWRVSRKSPEEWMKIGDKDRNGELNEKEFRAIMPHTGHGSGSLEDIDHDQSGGVNLAELEKYVHTKIERVRPVKATKIKGTP